MIIGSVQVRANLNKKVELGWDGDDGTNDGARNKAALNINFEYTPDYSQFCDEAFDPSDRLCWHLDRHFEEGWSVAESWREASREMHTPQP